MLEFREIKSESEYKLLELNPGASFTQAWFFGEWQEAMGRKVRRFEIKNDSETLGFFQMIKYSLLFGQSFLYIPHAPVLRLGLRSRSYFGEGDSFSEGGDPLPDFLKVLHEKLVEIEKEENAIFVRFDLCFHNFNYESKENKENFEKYFKKTPTYAYRSSYFQPKFEWIIDLKKSEEEILNNIHPKARYNINLARKRGIKIEIINENFNKYFYDFFRLSEETARRGNFKLHPKTYYQNIFGKCDENKNAFLSVAEYNGKILAINLILLFGNTAYFLFAGSSGEYKNLMFSYLAQWEVIKEAKKRGFEVYNFGGVQGSGEGYKNYEGVSFFKKRFGGKLLEYSDSYDIILNPFWYFLYNLRKKLMFLISN